MPKPRCCAWAWLAKRQSTPRARIDFPNVRMSVTPSVWNPRQVGTLAPVLDRNSRGEGRERTKYTSDFPATFGRRIVGHIPRSGQHSGRSLDAIDVPAVILPP